MELLRHYLHRHVVTTYGIKRTIYVDDVGYPTHKDWIQIPDEKGNSRRISVEQYFRDTYHIQIQARHLPYFITFKGGKFRYIPVELCVLDGLDEDTRRDPRAIRELLDGARKNPQQKVEQIQSLSTLLSNNTVLKDWNIKIEAKPLEFKTSVLSNPRFVPNK